MFFHSKWNLPFQLQFATTIEIWLSRERRESIREILGVFIVTIFMGSCLFSYLNFTISWIELWVAKLQIRMFDMAFIWLFIFIWIDFIFIYVKSLLLFLLLLDIWLIFWLICSSSKCAAKSTDGGGIENFTSSLPFVTSLLIPWQYIVANKDNRDRTC